MRREGNRLIKVILLLVTIVILSFLNLEAQVDEQDSIVFSIDMENVVISGMSAPTDAQNAMHQVKILTDKDIQKKAQNQLEEVLASLPNVRLTNDPVLGTSIKMRGVASDNVNILIDGVPVVGRLNGGLDLSQINIADIKRIEMIEGPMSTLYGNNAAGGVINIITKSAIKKKYRVFLDNQFEWPGIQNHNLNLAMQKHGFFISASGRYFKHQLYDLDSTRIFDSFVDEDGNETFLKRYPWNPKEQVSLNGTVRFNLNQQSYLMYKNAYSDQNLIDLGKLTRPQFMPYAFDNNYTTIRKDQSLKFHSESKKYFADVIFSLNNYDRYSVLERFDFDDEKLSPLESDTTSLQVYFARANVASNFKGPFNYIAGVNYNLEKGFGDRILDPESEDSSKVIVNDFALFGDLKYSVIENLNLSLSGRLTFNSRYGAQLTPGLKLLWKTNDFWTIRGSVVKGFRTPTLKERFINFVDVNHYIVSNPNLEPEESIDFSLSAGFEIPESNRLMQINFGTYYTSIDQKIVLAEFEPAKFNYQNLEDFTSYGLNGSISYGNKKWKYNGALSFGFWETNISNGVASKPIFDMQHGFEYSLPYGINSNLQFRYVGSEPQFVLNNGVVEESTLEAYELLDVHLQKKLFKNKVLFGTGIKNILNVQSVGINGSGGVGPHNGGAVSQLVNQGRSIYLKLSIEIQ